MAGHDPKSLYIVFQYDINKEAYVSEAYNGAGSKKPAFRRLTLQQVDQLHSHVIAGINKMLYRCCHCTNAKSIPDNIRNIHEEAAEFSHAKQHPRDW